MSIDIMETAGLIAALSVIGGVLFGVFTFYTDSKRQKDEIKAIKKEQTVICFALSACLEGLHQMGCNGKVTEALNRMDKHLNKAAHDEE